MQRTCIRPGVLVTLLALLAVAVFGCAQSGSSGQRSSESRLPTTIEKGRTAEQTEFGHRMPMAEQTTQSNEQTEARVDEPSSQQAKQVDPEADQQGQQTVTVHVTGTEGLSFRGNVSSGQELRRVQGTIPEKYELPVQRDASVVNVSVRKQGREEGSIEVELTRDGQMLANKESSGKAGIVNMVWFAKKQGNGSSE